jgi:hypothetical protein
MPVVINRSQQSNQGKDPDKGPADKPSKSPKKKASDAQDAKEKVTLIIVGVLVVVVFVVGYMMFTAGSGSSPADAKNGLSATTSGGGLGSKKSPDSADPESAGLSKVGGAGKKGLDSE